MSITKEISVGFHFFQFFSASEKDELLQPHTRMTEILDFVLSLPKEQRILKLPSSSKAHAILEYSKKRSKGNHFINIKIGSASYDSNPDLFNVNTGDVKPNTKSMEDGELQICHIQMLFLEDSFELLFAHEEGAGIGVGAFRAYVNKFGQRRLSEQRESIDFKVRTEPVPRKDFFEELDKLQKVSVGYIYTQKQALGSDFLNFVGDTRDIRDEIVIEYKAVKGASHKDASYELASKIGSDGSMIKRLRVRGVGENEKQTILNTDLTKTKEKIDVDADDVTRQTIDKSVYPKFQQLLEDLLTQVV